MKKAKKSIALIVSVLVLALSFTAMFALADGTEVIWSNSFETEEERSQWTFTDLDGDGNNWMWKSNENDAEYPAYDGLYSMYSESWSGSGALTPDNIAVSNAIELKETSAPNLRINWYVASQNFYEVEEHYSVYLLDGSVSDENIASSLNEDTFLFEEILSEKTPAYHVRTYNITERIAEMFDADGTSQTVRIVFRHHESTDKMALKIDAVSIEAYYEYSAIADYDFEDGLQGWTTIDGDGDGHNWEHKISADGFNGYLSEGCIASASYDEDTLYPENYIISPEIEISKKYSSPVLSWYAGSNHNTYNKEKYSAYVYDGSETLTKNNISGILSESTLLRDSELLEKTDYTLNTYPLDDLFVGTKIRIIFVHHNSSDQDWLKIDNVSIQAIEKTKPIDEIAITDIVEPVIGTVPSTDKTVSLKADGNDVTPAEANLVWQKKSGDSEYINMETDEVFAAGVSYRASVTINVSEDYIFTNDVASLTVNGREAEKVSIDASLQTITVAYDFAPQYTVTWNIDGVETTDSYAAGAAIEKPETPTKTGYTFDAWDAEVPETMPANNLTFTAQWNINTHTVTWDIDGEVTEQTYKYNETIVAPEAAKTGYKFLGWTPVFTEGTTMLDSDLDFVADFDPEMYDATFLADGGVFEENGTDIYEVSTAYDSAIIAPKNPTKTGYVFSGWTPDTGMDIMDTVGGETYTAIWSNATDTPYTVNVYTMGTDGEYGEADVKNLTGTTNSTVTYEPKLTAGLVLNAEKSNTEGVIAADGSLVLNVYIDREIYKLTIVTDDTDERDYYYGAAVTVADPVREGHTFDGWDMKIPETMPANDVTITALWTVNKHDVIYMVDGKEYDRAVGVEYGSAVTLIAEPAKEGYTFSGWSGYTEGMTMPDENLTISGSWELAEGYAEYSVDIYLMDEDGNYDALTPSDAIKKATNTDAEITINRADYPQEKYYIADGEDEYKITVTEDNKTSVKLYFKRLLQKIFYIDEEGMATPSDAKYYGKEYTLLPAPRAEKEGYTFEGWTVGTNSDAVPAGTTVTAEPQTDGEEVVYTAKWKINQYTITFADTGDVAYEEITQDYNTAIADVADPVKMGYTFMGWEDAEGNKVEIPATMPAENMAITATWEANAHTITWVNGENQKVVDVKYGDSINAITLNPKEGYTFKGWSTADDKTPADYPTVPDKDLVFAANWERNTYKITFNTNGGTEIVPIEQLYESFVTVPENPTKVGYTFEKWVDENGKETSIPENMPAYNMEITAIWSIESYKVIWDIDGEKTEETYKYNADLKIPAPTKTGYEFAGWNGLPEGTTKMYDLGGNGASVTYTATWTVNEYPAIFNTCGGAFEDGETSKSIDVNFDSDIVFTETPVREGYTFNGWNPAVGKMDDVNGKKFDAVWEANIYDAVFDANGGSWTDGDTSKTVPTDYNENIVAPADPAKTGYNFGGWTPAVGMMDDTNGKNFTVIWNAKGDTPYTVNVYTMGTDGEYGAADVKNLTGKTDTEVSYSPEIATGFELNTTKSNITGIVAADGSLELNIYIDRNMYAVKTVSDGKETTSTSYYYGAEVSKPAAPAAKTGHTFTGWDKEIPETMPAENITVTAQWTVNTYKIKWVVDGKITETTVTYGKTIAKPANPSKTGYTFIGWSPEVPATQGAADATYKATWKVNSYTVTWKVDGKTTKTETYTYGAKINKPADPAKTGYKFTGWSGYTDGMTMPANNLTFTASFVCETSIKIINNPGTCTINYGDILVLTADTEGLPEGAIVRWYVNGLHAMDNGFYEETVTDDVTITVKVLDKNGNVLKDADGNEISDSQKINANDGFFQIIISFFKNLFGMNRRKYQ